MSEHICKNCEHFRLFTPGFHKTEWYMNAGKCENPKVYDYVNNKNTLIRAGGSEGDGDYFHVKESFGCIAWKEVERLGNARTEAQ